MIELNILRLPDIGLQKSGALAELGCALAHGLVIAAMRQR